MVAMPEMKLVLPQLVQKPKRFCGNLPIIYSFAKKYCSLLTNINITDMTAMCTSVAEAKTSAN